RDVGAIHRDPRRRAEAVRLDGDRLRARDVLEGREALLVGDDVLVADADRGVGVVDDEHVDAAIDLSVADPAAGDQTRLDIVAARRERGAGEEWEQAHRTAMIRRSPPPSYRRIRGVRPRTWCTERDARLPGARGTPRLARSGATLLRTR